MYRNVYTTTLVYRTQYLYALVSILGSMVETYDGVKFKTKLQSGIINHPLIDNLIAWCKKMDSMGVCPSYGKGNAGNLSFRCKNGFIITSTACFYKDMSKDDVTHVTSIEGTTVHARGMKEPSSETMLHDAIYKKRSDVNAIIHGHSDILLDNASDLNIKTTKNEQPYGTKALVDEVMKTIGDEKLIAMKNHGFISLGKTLDKAGNLVIKTTIMARSLSSGQN